MAWRFCEVYRAVGAMVTAGGKLFLGEGGRKKVSSLLNLQVMRNISHGWCMAGLTFYIPVQGCTIINVMPKMGHSGLMKSCY